MLSVVPRYLEQCVPQTTLISLLLIPAPWVNVSVPSLLLRSRGIYSDHIQCSRSFQCGNSKEFCSKEEGCLSGCGAHTINSVTSIKTFDTEPRTTSKATTLMKSTSTTSTTKAEAVTVTVTTPEKPAYSWGVILYEDAGCKAGNYFSLAGHDNSQECLVLSKLTATAVSDDATSCRWFTNGGFEWEKCSASDLKYPKSWNLLRGGCAAYLDEKCQENGGSIKFKGCGYRQSIWSPEKIVAIKCWDNTYFT